MCTITLVPFDKSLRLACNRDEAVTRPAALPPQIRRYGNRTALMPIDPTSNGSWLAVNDAGLAVVIVNRNPPVRAGVPPLLSRGTIVPQLIGCDTLSCALQQAFVLPGNDYAPFRLVLATRQELIVIDGGEGPASVRERGPLDEPRIFASSGLGDDRVTAVRKELFQTFRFDERGETQLAFHRHAWPDRRHLSVCMRRPGARTVSLTMLELRETRAEMTYWPRPPDEAGPEMTSSIELGPR